MAYDDEMFEEEEDDVEEEQAPRRPAKSSTNWTCLAIVLGGGFLTVVVVCCGGGGFLTWFGMNVISAEIEDELRDNVTLKEHVGEIESFSFDLVRTAAGNDDKKMVFEVKGSQGSGTVTVIADTDRQGKHKIQSAELRLADGKTVTLVP